MPDYDENRLQLAVAMDDRLATLKTLRTMLAERFDKASLRDSAPIARQFQLVCEEISTLEAADDSENEDDPMGEINARWAARMARTSREGDTTLR